ELQQARIAKWHLDGHTVRTLEDGRSFLESVGFCLLYPLKQPLLVPTFVGAWVGAEDHLPTWQHSFSDPRAQDARELMVRLLRDRAAFEANLFDENNAFLVTASAFPYFYALVGERNPRQAPKAVREGIELSVGQALSALLSKYLDCVIAADQQELENFFGNFVPRSRVKEAVNALLAARELSFVHVGNRSLIQVSPPRQAFSPNAKLPRSSPRPLIEPRRS